MDRKVPLSGLTVLLTRPRNRSAGLADGLRALGARVIELPATVIAPPGDPAPLARALGEKYDCAVFASVNAVESVASALAAAGRGPDALRGTQLFAVGPATVASLQSHGFGNALAPESGTGEGMLALFAGKDVAGKRFLVPGAREGRAEVAEGLRARGARVVEVEAYQTLPADPASPDVAEALAALAGTEIGATVLASPSAVHALDSLLEPRIYGKLRATPVVAIGPTTADAARKAGWDTVLEAERRTDDGVLSCIRKHFEDNR